jgi:hypothetical protein
MELCAGANGIRIVTENRVLEAGVDWVSASNRPTVAMESVGTEFINGTAAESVGEAAEAATEKMLGSWRRAIRCPEVRFHRITKRMRRKTGKE